MFIFSNSCSIFLNFWEGTGFDFIAFLPKWEKEGLNQLHYNAELFYGVFFFMCFRFTDKLVKANQNQNRTQPL